MLKEENRPRCLAGSKLMIGCAFSIVAMTFTFPACTSSEFEDGTRSELRQLWEPPSRSRREVKYKYVYWAKVIFTYWYHDPDNDKKLTGNLSEKAEGKYGVAGPKDQRTGLIVHVRDKHNRSTGCERYTNKIPEVQWIALIERGDCFFTDKIKMATQTYNANAAIIYNDKDEGITIMEHTVTNEVSIFVSRETGKKLARLADAGMMVEVTIVPDRIECAEHEFPEFCSALSKNSKNAKSSVPFVSVSFIVVIFYYI